MNILLGVTGGISAYKSAELVRLLKLDHFDVRVVMTKSAQEFVGPLTFQALSGYPVSTNTFHSKSDSGMDHIRLPRWADFILIAPATADYIARLAHGLADDLLTTISLAAEVPIAIAPAMNQQMWQNSITQHNLELLKQRGIICFGPAHGDQACGEFGPGRMLEPEELLECIKLQFHHSALAGKNIVITAGATQEWIDPVRYISNHSTGTMGYALAEAASFAGAKVTLISGPSNLSISKSVQKISVISALEMENAVVSCIEQSDVFISTAAVSDYRPEIFSSEKIKKTNASLTLNLIRNSDILSKVGNLENKPFIVGFAAETEELLKNAKIKLQEKNMDMIIANQVGQGIGFGEVETSVTVLTPDGKIFSPPKQSKKTLSKLLIQYIAEFLSM